MEAPGTEQAAVGTEPSAAVAAEQRHYTPEQWAQVQAYYAHPQTVQPSSTTAFPTYMQYGQQMYMGGYYPYHVLGSFPFAGAVAGQTLAVPGAVEPGRGDEAGTAAELGVTAENVPKVEGAQPAPGVEGTPTEGTEQGDAAAQNSDAAAHATHAAAAQPATSDPAAAAAQAQAQAAARAQAAAAAAAQGQAVAYAPAAYDASGAVVQQAAPYAAVTDLWRAQHAGQVVDGSGMTLMSAHPDELVCDPLQQGMPQDERELKRQRRKQSNRESARRSRLRKQAECERLATNVDELKRNQSELMLEIAECRTKMAKLSSDKQALIGQVTALGGMVDSNILQEPPDPPSRVTSAATMAYEEVSGVAAPPMGNGTLVGQIEDDLLQEPPDPLTHPTHHLGSITSVGPVSAPTA